MHGSSSDAASGTRVCWGPFACGVVTIIVVIAGALHVPWDEALGLGAAALTPAVSEVASIAGVQASFAQSAEVTLQKLCGLRLSESTVERVAEGAGQRLKKLLADKITFGENQPWAWQRDAHGRSCAYVGLDATGVR